MQLKRVILSCMTQLRERQTEFDRLANLEPLSSRPPVIDTPSTFAVDLPQDWSALIGIHGGYLTTLAVRGAELVVPDRAVRTITTSFLRPAHPGPAQLRVCEQRRSKSISTAMVEIRQCNRPVTTSRLTLISPQSGVEWRSLEPIDLPPIDECVPITPPNPVAHFERARGLLDPSSLPFTDGPRAMVRGYLRPLEHRPIDAAWLAMASDWFPPPAFVRLAPPLGGISVDLTTHVHHTVDALDDDEWLTASFEVTTSAGGLATEHGRIATVDGDVLAESFQTRWMVAG